MILDKAIGKPIRSRVPLSMIRSYKESYSYAGESESGARVKVPVGGKPRKIEIGKQVGFACNELVQGFSRP